MCSCLNVSVWGSAGSCWLAAQSSCCGWASEWEGYPGRTKSLTPVSPNCCGSGPKSPAGSEKSIVKSLINTMSYIVKRHQLKFYKPIELPKICFMFIEFQPKQRSQDRISLTVTLQIPRDLISSWYPASPESIMCGRHCHGHKFLATNKQLWKYLCLLSVNLWSS